MSEISYQISEVRNQKSEVRGRKSVTGYWLLVTFPLLSVLCILLLSGCGYKPLPSLRGDIKKIYIPTFQNHTYEPSISAILTDALREEILLDGTFQLTSSEEAQAVLRGTVISYEHSSTIYDQGQNMVGGSAKIKVQATFKYVGGEIIWKEEIGDEESTSYFLTGSLSSREVELKKFIAKKVAQKIVTLITEEW